MQKDYYLKNEKTNNVPKILLKIFLNKKNSLFVLRTDSEFFNQKLNLVSIK